MSTNNDIANAFKAVLATFAAAQGIPVAWPGVAFTPPQTGSWLEMAWFPNETMNLAFGAVSQYRGFGQVSCCCRPGPGDGVVLALADAVIDAFPKGTQLGIARVERKPWASSELSAPDRIAVPVTVRYQGGIVA